MDEKSIQAILARVSAGEIDTEGAVAALRALGTSSLAGFARLDHHRELRCGFPEVVFGPGKEPALLVALVERIAERSGRALVTRVEEAGAEALRHAFPAGRWHERARAFVLENQPPPPLGPVAIVTGGTSDAAVAEEARVSAEALGCACRVFYDCGVAGLHRLLAVLDEIRAARVVIAVAGMEGALPSVLAGLIDRPVLAVPTSVGYGAAFDGLAALLTMINSCASGVTVVNIDNGFGAAYAAAQILRSGNAAPTPPPPPPTDASSEPRRPPRQEPR